MKRLRKKSSPISIVMIIFVLNLITPIQPVFAALIGTDTYVEKEQIDNAREKVNVFLSKQKVTQAMIQQGVNPEEVQNRMANLSDQEIMKISKQIDKLPAGGDGVSLVIGVLIIVILVLVIMKLL
jgi:VIT1/CCC1 family predicted Fe2+/Mn2+ transporter